MSNGYGFLFGGDEYILKLIVVMVYNSLNTRKTIELYTFNM